MSATRLIAACCVFAAAAFTGTAAPTQAEAKSAAEAWLFLVDHQQYAQSWAEAGSVFRTRVPQDTWSMMAEQTRSPLGPVVSRSLLKVTTSKALPGVPDGDYAIIQFRSAFQHKAQAVETVTLSFEEGKLKCVGYFIK
jgi:hypothetical protein